MKPQKENIFTDSMYSFRVNHAKLPYLDSPWHFHPEFELLYIIKSSGKRFVGDSIENFYEGDMVLMSPNLPHVWKNSEDYYQKKSKLKAEAIVIQFKENAFGELFFNLPEMQLISRLFNYAKRGLKITGKTKEIVRMNMYEIIELKGVVRFNKLIETLDILSKSTELIPLATRSFEKTFYHAGSEKINKVFEYVANNFRKNITLDEIADHANMSKTAFCRYFKQRSLKTFFEYLNEVRINYACKLLLENKLSISEISFECGFNSHTYFNRQFRQIKKQSPKEFLQEHKMMQIE